MRRPLLGLAALGASLLAMSNLVNAQPDDHRPPKPAVARALAQAAPPSSQVRKPRLRKMRMAASSLQHRPYTFATTSQHATSNFEITLLGVATAVYFAVNGWNKSDPQPFHFQREGWFGKDTYAGGMDKLGHFFSANLFADVITLTLKNKGFDPYESAISGSVMSWFMMAAIETGDGISHYGFSWEDMTFNTLGAGFSFLRNTVPGLKEKLDFRVQYIPSGNTNYSASGDYSNKKFLFALKLSGFDHLKETPWRFVELHAGYFARGFSETERSLGRPQEQRLYAGIGLNLSEIFFSDRAVRDTPVGQAARFALEYVQVPYTAINTRN